MPRYIPIDITPRINATFSNVMAFEWVCDPVTQSYGVAATFRNPDDLDNVIAVRFTGQCIVRLVDEFSLSTEENITQKEGLDGSLAYRVEGAAFYEQQSSIWLKRPSGTSAIHYQFITGWTCLDVLCHKEPEIFIVAASDDVAWRVRCARQNTRPQPHPRAHD